MIYLGSPGRMVGIKCPTVQRLGASDRYVFQETLEGKVKAQVVPNQRRVWDVSTGRLTTPAEVGMLMNFASGGWGSGPFWFLPADAPVVNVMPAQELMELRETGTNVEGGPMRLAGGGWAANSLALVGDGSQIRWRYSTESDPPVIPGVPVTGSVWVLGANADVALQFINDNGEVISTVSSSNVSASVEGVRVSVTAMPPSDAVRVSVIARRAIRAAQPAITFTDQLYPWGDGQGCRQAVIHSVSRDVTKAFADPRTGRWSDVSFVVQEVG